MNEVTQRSIAKFNEDPKSYLLQVVKKKQVVETVVESKGVLATEHVHKEVTELHILKKGLWTWLKIHVGGNLGLFDKNSVKLTKVATFFFKNEKEFQQKNSQFFNNVNEKIKHWEGKHFPIVQSEKTILENQTLTQILDTAKNNVEKEAVFSKFLTENNHGSIFSSISTSSLANGDVVISLIPSRLFFSSRLLTADEKKQAVNLKALREHLLDNKPVGSNEIKKVLYQNYKELRFTLHKVDGKPNSVEVETSLFF